VVRSDAMHRTAHGTTSSATRFRRAIGMAAMGAQAAKKGAMNSRAWM